MPRRVEDIVPADHRSIRDIPSARSATRRPAPSRSKEREEDEDDIPIRRVKEPSRRMPITPPPLPPRKRPRSHRFKWPIITLVIFAVIAVGGYLASTLYSRATFAIVPKVIPISINGTRPYMAEAASDTAQKSDVITYKLITLRATASTTVSATDGAMTNTKSAGKITIYNNFSAQPIRLIAGTRLAGENGLLYRLTSSIVVPGYTKPSGTIVAGKISTGVIADQPGQRYNISKAGFLEDLKIVAYKGSARYDTVYARLATDIAGGFSGTKKIISPSVIASTTGALKSSLTDSLLSQAKSSVMEGYIMYDSGYIMAFGAPVIGDSRPGIATIAQQGTIYAIIFQRNALIDAFAGSSVTSLFGDFSYTAPGLESLNIVINNIKDFSPEKKTGLIIHAKGDLKLVGTIPVEEIKSKLTGVSLADTDSILRAYSPVIESATGELLPPWVKVPDDVSRIEINVEKGY